MAKIVLLTPEENEARRIPKRRLEREARERQIGEWMELLRSVAPGWAGDVELEEGDEKKKVRLMLKEAAERLGLMLRFRPLKDGQRMQFEVIDPANSGATDGAATAAADDQADTSVPSDGQPRPAKSAKPRRRARASQREKREEKV